LASKNVKMFYFTRKNEIIDTLANENDWTYLKVLYGIEIIASNSKSCNLLLSEFQSKLQEKNIKYTIIYHAILTGFQYYYLLFNKITDDFFNVFIEIQEYFCS